MWPRTDVALRRVYIPQRARLASLGTSGTFYRGVWFRNRFANKGEITPPRGVSATRAPMLPSSICIDALPAFDVEQNPLAIRLMTNRFFTICLSNGSQVDNVTFSVHNVLNIS
jgi:hypothetical protein